MEDSCDNNLEQLGFLSQNGMDSKTTNLLQAILQAQRNEGSDSTFSVVYETYTELEGGKPKSKPYVHRLLNALIDIHVIRVEGLEGRKRKYLCDINTLASGLSFLKEQRLSDLAKEKEKVNERTQEIESIDANELATQLYERLTGEKKTPTSRFLKGLDEFQRVTNETIYHVAKVGDIIRTSVTGIERFSSEPFVNDFASRVQRVIVAASKGVDVRYSIPPVDLGNISQLWKSEEGVQFFADLSELIVKDEGEGPGFHFRFNSAGQKSHQFVSLNNDIVTLWISEYPPTAAWITREFNADLIDHIINTFDEQWKQASSVREHLRQVMSEKGKK
ncbi:MAG: hypothetical protein ACFFED_11425 [Candidatus Thorarchaeota archaeon]